MQGRPRFLLSAASFAGAATLVLLALAPGRGATLPPRATRIETIASSPRYPRDVRFQSRPAIAVEVTGSPTGQPLPPGFLGFSLEYPALRQYVGPSPRSPNPLLKALIQAVNPGQSPVLRIGGNSTDQTWWPAPGAMPPPTGVSYALTRGWLAAAHALAAQLDARMILGINLAAGSSALAATEARALIRGVGRRYVAALEIGNEPDMYTRLPRYRAVTGRTMFARPPGYDLRDYLAQVARWRAALPPVPLAGPALAKANWMADLPLLLATERQLTIVTFHRYPLRACETNPRAADYPTIQHLMSDAASAGLAKALAGFVAAAHRAGDSFRVDELNSVSCEGRHGVSDTFASALWVMDTLFELASVGVDGVNVHTLPGARYVPFGFTHTGSGWSATVHPLYYGLLMFSQAFPAGARLVTLDAPSGPVKAWATQGTDGHLRVLLINRDPRLGATVDLKLPGLETPVSEELLTAPSLRATSAVSLGGESFGRRTSTGILPVDVNPPLLASTLDGYVVTVPPASAVLLTR